MTVRANFRTALLDALQTALPTITVTPVPPGENQGHKEAVWIGQVTSDFDWRTLGGPAHYARNRSEELAADIRVHVYREAPSQNTAAATMIARAEEIVALIEEAVALDPSVGDTVSHALVRTVQITPEPAESGWYANCTLRVEASSLPV